MGWPSPKGKLWRGATIHYLLHQSYYWGEPVAFRVKSLELPEADVLTGEVEMVPRRRARPLAERVKLPASSVPALIAQEKAERVLQYLDERKIYRPTSASRLLRKDDFLLYGGFLRCGVCHNNLGPCKGYGRSDYYTCNAGIQMPKGSPKRHTLTIQADYAERFMAAQVVRLLLTPGEAEAAIARLASQDETYNDELAVAKSKLAEVEQALKNRQRYLDTMGDEEDMTEFAEGMRQLRIQRGHWQGRVASLQVSSAHVEHLAASLHRVMRAARETTEQATAALATVEAHQTLHTQGTTERSHAAWEQSVERLLQARDALAEARQAVHDTLPRFAEAPKTEQRKVLRALGVWLEVQPGISGGQKHQTIEQRLRLHLGLHDDFGVFHASGLPGQANLGEEGEHGTGSESAAMSSGGLQERTAGKMQARKR
jgi:hypothetical protein